MRRLPRLLAAFALLLLVAGCATGPQYPLYSPLAVTGTFGFSEQRLSDTSYRTTYVTPRRTAYSPYAGSEPRRTALLTLANDMAMMRAAELASANGYETFRVTQRDNDANVDRTIPTRAIAAAPMAIPTSRHAARSLSNSAASRETSIS
jgi:hypothetical protein